MAANTGIHNPPGIVLFFLVLSIASAAAVIWGIAEMPEDQSAPSPAGAAVGAGAAIGIVSLGMLYLTFKSWRKTLALASGKDVIARWTVSADEYRAFLVNNAERNGLGPDYQNDWKPRDAAPEGGLKVVFGKDIVSVGDRAFGLVNTGMFTFEGVQILPENPLAIEFGTLQTSLSEGASSVYVNESRGVLRIPIARAARDDAVRVLNFYKRVDAHEIVVNPEFYRGRMKFGLIAAPVCLLLAALGYVLESAGAATQMVNLVLMIGGIISALGAVVLAAAAAYLGWLQRTPTSRP